MAREKIRIKLRGYDHELVDTSIRKIVDSAKETRAKISGPIPLPTERRVYTVLRSPHVCSAARRLEQEPSPAESAFIDF